MKYILFIIFSIYVDFASCQNVGISNTNAIPHASAQLDVASISKGMLVPRMTSLQRGNITIPAKGLLVFDITSDSFWFYDGLDWQDLGSPKIQRLTDLDGDTEIEVDSGFDNDLITIDIEGGRVLNLRKTNNGFVIWDVQGTSQNNAFGDNSGTGFASGSFGNNLFGNFIMDNGEGSFNTIMGHVAGGAIVDADNNTIIGAAAGNDLLNGDYNTMIGRKAGQNTTTADYSVFLGHGAGYNENQSNRLHIDNKTSSSPTESLIYGEFTNELVRINGELQVRDEYSFPETDGANGQILTTDGNGAVSWMTPSGSGSGTSDEIIDADGNTKIQVEESSNDDIIRFDINGFEKFSMQRNTSGIATLSIKNNLSNVNIGDDAGIAITSGGYNVLVGDDSGKSLTSGTGNTIVGNASGDAIISASDNTLVGNEAGAALTGSENVLLGSQAGKTMVSGDDNIMIGFSAGLNNDQSNNVMIGHKSGSTNNGSGNIFIGHEAGKNTSGSNKLAIDNFNTTSPLIEGDFSNNELIFNGDVEVTGVLGINNLYDLPTNIGGLDQVLTMGAGGSTYWSTPTVGGGGGSGSWVSIGGPSLKPSADQNVCVDCPGTIGNFSTLSIGATGPVGREVSITSDEKYALWIKSSYVSTDNVSNGTVRIESDPNSKTSALYVTQGDSISPTIRAVNTGTGKAFNAYSFYGSGLSAQAGFNDNLVGGNFSATNGATGTGVNGLGSGIGVNGICTEATGWDFYAAGAGGDYGTMSSRRWKKDIRNIDDPISKLKALRGVYYTWDEEHGGSHDLGFIAEEIAEQLPEIVQYDTNGVDVNGLDYSKTTPLILEAVRVHIEDYETTISNLQEKLNAQEAEILKMKEMLTKLLRE